MAWSFSSDRAVYLQIMEEIKLRIISGFYPYGTKIPSVRDLAEEARVNPNTMQKALSELEREGMIFSQRTTGKFVTGNTERIIAERNAMARGHIEEFIEKMRKLGFNKEETLKMLSEEKK